MAYSVQCVPGALIQKREIIVDIRIFGMNSKRLQIMMERIRGSSRSSYRLPRLKWASA